MRESRIRTVVLTVRYGVRASYYEDWLDAFAASPLFSTTSYNLFNRGERRAAMRALGEAELVVALHACTADTLEYILPLRQALQARRGRFLMFVGNEYNLPWAPLGEKRRLMREVGADWGVTQMPLEAGQYLYADCAAAVLALPHAANEAVFRREKPDAARSIDLGGRSFRYPVFLGDNDRNRVYDLFAELGPALGLRVDISTGSRLDRPGWAAFLNDCRGTVGTEAGTWYVERDDATALAIRDFLRDRSLAPTIRADSWLHAAARRLPYGVKSGLRAVLSRSALRHEAFDLSEDAFAEVQARFFAGRPHCPAYAKCISSRHFEAAATGTCQILVKGRFNDILEADRHYIALEPGLGNAAEALVRFRDPAERRRIADAAQALVHQGHTYRHRLTELHSAVSAASH
jgi:hypothetical protein